MAAPEIGAPGYYFAGHLLDGCGLVTPEAVPFLPVPAEQRRNAATGAISIEFVQATRPEWVVTMPVFAERSLLPSEWFHQHYELARRVRLPKPVWLSTEILVFKRRDL